jgi:hypothetical protein
MTLPFILAPVFALAQTAQCSDGSISNSADFQGTCSHHGGVEVWLGKEMEEQANDWCDENPDWCANSHWRGIGGHGNHSDDDGSEVQPSEQRSSHSYGGKIVYPDGPGRRTPRSSSSDDGIVIRGGRR